MDHWQAAGNACLEDGTGDPFEFLQLDRSKGMSWSISIVKHGSVRLVSGAATAEIWDI